jgi:hypothetical protein
MMTGSVMASACRAGECLRAGTAGAPGVASARGTAVAALVTWLVAELFGAIMLRSWIASGGVRDRDAMPRGLSPALIFGHAGMALTGLVSWISFVVSGSAALAWTGIGFLALAIGLGISTVTVWTPFPARRLRHDDAPHGNSRAGDQGEGAAAAREGAQAPDAGVVPSPQATPAILVTNEMLDRALDDEAIADKLVDDLLARMLAGPPARPQPSRTWQLAPVIPIVHGVLAIVTFLLAMLAIIAAVR